MKKKVMKVKVKRLEAQLEATQDLYIDLIMRNLEGSLARVFHIPVMDPNPSRHNWC